jgi:parallel beta-helix repeat protein
VTRSRSTLGLAALALLLGACGGGGGSPAAADPAAVGSAGDPGTASSAPGGGPSSRATLSVASASQLASALVTVNPGDTIELAAGTYTGAFVITRSGTASLPITLKGPATAILQNDKSTGKNYGLYLSGASYWVIDGLTVSNSQKGIVTDHSNFNVLQNLSVHDVEDEGVHFRSGSSDNTLQHSAIYNTGLVQPGYGEAVYLGSANSNWGVYTASAITPDPSNRNKVLSNTLGPNVAAEGVDVKEGTSGGLIQGNAFDTRGISGQNSGDSAIDMKGDDYVVDSNTVVNTPVGPTNCTATTGWDNKNCLKDGFQLHLNTVAGITYGYNNTFSKNAFNLNTTASTAGYYPLPSGGGYGINIQSGATGTVVCTNNSATIASAGLSNWALTSCP